MTWTAHVPSTLLRSANLSEPASRSKYVICGVPPLVPSAIFEDSSLRSASRSFRPIANDGCAMRLRGVVAMSPTGTKSRTGSNGRFV